MAWMAAYTALEKEEDRHGEGRGSRGRVVWLRLPWAHKGPFELCPQTWWAGKPRSEWKFPSWLFSSWNQKWLLRAQVSEPGMTADRQPPRRRNTNSRFLAEYPAEGSVAAAHRGAPPSCWAPCAKAPSPGLSACWALRALFSTFP